MHSSWAASCLALSAVHLTRTINEHCARTGTRKRGTHDLVDVAALACLQKREAPGEGSLRSRHDRQESVRNTTLFIRYLHTTRTLRLD